MKLNDTTNVSTSMTGTKFGISANAFSFRVLSDNLYKDKKRAVIRELTSNAVDATGEGDNKPVITIDTYNNMITITDFGCGMSDEFVNETYSTFFASSKRGTNDATGMLGLGSKTPLAIADSFTVTTKTQDEEKGRLYMVALDESGVPQITRLTDEVECEKGTSIHIEAVKEKMYSHDYISALDSLALIYHIEGVEVWLDGKRRNSEECVTVHGFKKISTGARDYIQLTDDMYLTLSAGRASTYFGTDNAIYHNRDTLYIDNIKVLDNSSYSGTAVNIIQGTAVYPVKVEFDNAIRVPYNAEIVLNMPIGSLSITPSREELEITIDNKAAIRRALFKSLKEIAQYGPTAPSSSASGMSEFMSSAYVTGLQIDVSRVKNIAEHRHQYKVTTKQTGKFHSVYVNADETGEAKVKIVFLKGNVALKRVSGIDGNTLVVRIKKDVDEKEALKNMQSLISDSIFMNNRDHIMGVPSFITVSEATHSISAIERVVSSYSGPRSYRWLVGETSTTAPEKDMLYSLEIPYHKWTRSNMSNANYIMRIADEQGIDLPAQIEALRVGDKSEMNIPVRTPFWKNKNDPEGKLEFTSAFDNLLSKNNKLKNAVIDYTVERILSTFDVRTYREKICAEWELEMLKKVRKMITTCADKTPHKLLHRDDKRTIERVLGEGWEKIVDNNISYDVTSTYQYKNIVEEIDSAIVSLELVVDAA